MLDVKTFLRLPVEFKRGIFIYPPSVKEVVSEANFNIYYKLLSITQDEIDEQFKNEKDTKRNPTPFEYLFTNSYSKKDFFSLLQKAFIFFLREPVTLLYEEKIIIIGDLKEEVSKINDISELRILREEEYFNFQNAIRDSLGFKPAEPPIVIDPNEDPRIIRMKLKAKERDRIKNKQGTKDGLTLGSCLTAICCMGIGLTPLNIGDISYASVEALMATAQEKERYETDIKSLLAGADPKKVKPKYWIRNLD